MNNLLRVERARFHIKDRNMFVVQLWMEDDSRGEEQFEAYLDNEPLNAKVITQHGIDVRQKYLRYEKNIELEYFLQIQLPGDLKNKKKLELYHKTEAGNEKVYGVSVRVLEQMRENLNCWVDKVKISPEGNLMLEGWFASSERVKISVIHKGQKLKYASKAVNRSDVLREFPEAKEAQTRGFELILPGQAEEYGKLTIVLKSEQRHSIKKVNSKQELNHTKSLLCYVSLSREYYSKYGWKAFSWKVKEKLLGKDKADYAVWRKHNMPKEKELEAQRNYHFENAKMFSIVVPLYRTDKVFLKEMIHSVKQQTYTNWELCLSDGSGSDSPLTGLLDQLAAENPKIKVIHNQTQLKISENTNRAIETAQGDFLVFADHDDRLAPNALFECAKALEKFPELELIYTDEDKIDMKGKKYFQPHFKSDFNMDLLCSMNYISHLSVVKKELADRVGYLRAEFDGAQDYDFILRCVEEIAEKEHIYHIPKVLYHWRAHMDSTAENPESKRYAFLAGARAIREHYERVGIHAKVEEGQYPGLYRSFYEIKEDPLVSIIIPNKDHIQDLKVCLESIESKSDYRNYEYIIVENNSTEKSTFDYYRQLEKENPKVHVCFYEGEFNFSAIMNFGAAKARGDYFLLLNNDTEMIGEDCIRELLGYCMREDVGLVGARLYYGDDTIQHAGVVIGFGGVAGHAFIGCGRSENGYFSRIICAQDYSAVTAACMMVKRSVYEAVNGFSEKLRVAFNDIDFCLKVRALGKLVVYNPYAQLYHYESKSRGLEDTQEKVERFNNEVAVFIDRWKEVLKEGDPYFNPNLSLDKADFSIRN